MNVSAIGLHCEQHSESIMWVQISATVVSLKSTIYIFSKCLCSIIQALQGTTEILHQMLCQTWVCQSSSNASSDILCGERTGRSAIMCGVCKRCEEGSWNEYSGAWGRVCCLWRGSWTSIQGALPSYGRKGRFNADTSFEFHIFHQLFNTTVSLVSSGQHNSQ